MAVYAPKKRKLNYKIVIIVVLACMVIGYFGVQFLFPKSEEDKLKEFTVCGFSKDKTDEVLGKSYTETYSLSDYLYYGEDLILLKNTYDIENSDELSGKSVILKDLCSDKEYSFVFGSTIDKKLILNNIKEGYYELYVVENLVEKRVVFTQDVNSSINTITRDNQNYKDTLLASQSYFKNREVSMDQNYLFLSVKKTNLADDEYDIVLDPGANDYDFTYTLNKGSEANSLVEANETYKAAELLKEKFEAKGLKVLILRKQDEVCDSYGEDGRLQRAYLAKAKYYFRLSFSESKANYSGLEIAYSGHASNSFAAQIIYDMTRNSDVNISAVYSINYDGVVEPTLLSGSDGRSVYDSDLWIRESGGKASAAGMYSDNAKEGTAFFAKDNLYGMNALNIYLGYLTNSKDVDYWNNHKEEYMSALADSISSYLNVEE